MESWRKVWREGFVPVLSDKALLALRTALQKDDARMIQGATTTPPPLMCVQDWPVEAACALGLCGWQGEDLKTVGEVEEYFATKCYEADSRLGEPAACRWYLNWFDDTPRAEMVRDLLAEVELALHERTNGRDGTLPRGSAGVENNAVGGEGTGACREAAGNIPNRSGPSGNATGTGQATERLDPVAGVINPLEFGP